MHTVVVESNPIHFFDVFVSTEAVVGFYIVMADYEVATFKIARQEYY